MTVTVTTLEDLANIPLADLAAEPLDRLSSNDPVVAAIVRRLTDPAERDKLTVSAFGSAL